MSSYTVSNARAVIAVMVKNLPGVACLMYTAISRYLDVNLMHAGHQALARVVPLTQLLLHVGYPCDSTLIFVL